MRINATYRMIAGIMTVWAMLSLSSCDRTDADELSAGGEKTLLVLRVGTIGQTRAAADSNNEQMHSLRIVVLKENGEVEINKLNSPSEEETYTLPISSGEKKKIFLFANEESVTGIQGANETSQTLSQFLGSYAAGTSGFENAVNQVYFTPDYNKDIPMSSVYEIDVPTGTKNIEKIMYVVRVATKWSVTFENWRNDAVTVKSFSIGNFANNNYLMAHVTPSDKNNTLFVGFDTWIDWLKDVSDKSNIDPNNPTADASGWLQDYEMPGDTKHEDTYTYSGEFILSALIEATGEEAPKPGTKILDSFYKPESKQLKDATVTDGEQEYTMNLTVQSQTEVKQFTQALPNVRALFRNTHVQLTIRFDGGGMQTIYGGIVYWGFYDMVSGIVEEETDSDAGTTTPDEGTE